MPHRGSAWSKYLKTRGVKTGFLENLVLRGHRCQSKTSIFTQKRRFGVVLEVFWRPLVLCVLWTPTYPCDMLDYPKNTIKNRVVLGY